MKDKTKNHPCNNQSANMLLKSKKYNLYSLKRAVITLNSVETEPIFAKGQFWYV